MCLSLHYATGNSLEMLYVFLGIGQTNTRCSVVVIAIYIWASINLVHWRTDWQSSFVSKRWISKCLEHHPKNKPIHRQDTGCAVRHGCVCLVWGSLEWCAASELLGVWRIHQTRRVGTVTQFHSLFPASGDQKSAALFSTTDFLLNDAESLSPPFSTDCVSRTQDLKDLMWGMAS